jgi:hypothetical protein
VITSKHNLLGIRSTARTAIVVAGALGLAIALGGAAQGATFLDEVDRGKAAVAASGAATMSAKAARAAAVTDAVTTDGKESPAFAIGANLAALNLDIEKPTPRAPGDRAVTQQQVRDLLTAQAESKIGNRALCLLSGRTNPRSLEAQMRTVEPGWTCGPVDHH